MSSGDLVFYNPVTGETMFPDAAETDVLVTEPSASDGKQIQVLAVARTSIYAQWSEVCLMAFVLMILNSSFPSFLVVLSVFAFICFVLLLYA